MSLYEKLDVLDLAITALKEHEKNIDALTHRIETLINIKKVCRDCLMDTFDLNPPLTMIKLGTVIKIVERTECEACK